MNRIQLPAWTALPRQSRSTTTPTAEHWFGDSTTPSPRYHLFAPLHYEPNYAYPLLIWLHGPQDHERQVQQIMPLVSLRNYAAIGPRGTHQHLGDNPGYYWGRSESAVAKAEQSVLDCLDIAQQRLHVNPERIFLAGYGCGGTMAFRVGLRHPQRFAGVLSLGGPFPQRGAPLASLSAVRRLPLFIAHGRDAKQYSIERLCADLHLFHAAGLAVTVRQYPCGDELTTQMLHDLDVWMMERVTGQPHTPSEPTVPAGELN